MRRRRGLSIWCVLPFLLLGFVIPQGAIRAADVDIHVIEEPPADANSVHEYDREEVEDMGETPIMVESVEDMVDKVLEELGQDDCIKNLYIYGHGEEGILSVGCGTKAAGPEKEINGSIEEWESQLERLRFCEEGATIYLFGCNVGSCDKGAKKLFDLAKSLGVTVKGPADAVTSGENGDYIENGRWQTATKNMTEPPECIPAAEEKAKKKIEQEEHGRVRLTSEEYFVYENVHSIYITVIREYGSDGEVTVDVFTTDGTATAPDDYTATVETLTWPDGDMTPKICYIEINDDAVAEGDEVFYLSLTNVTGGADLGTPSEAQVTIVDNEVLPENPTLSQWVLIVLAFSVAGFFIWQLKRRRRAVISHQ